MPPALVTVVENVAWPLSASVIEIEPLAVRLPAETLTSSVTVETVGVPITAASLAPLMVNVTTLVVPSALLMVKLSIFV